MTTRVFVAVGSRKLVGLGNSIVGIDVAVEDGCFSTGNATGAEDGGSGGFWITKKTMLPTRTVIMHRAAVDKIPRMTICTRFTVTF